MNIVENKIESCIRNIEGIYPSQSKEYDELYSFTQNKNLQGLLSGLHFHLIYLFRRMNERLPTHSNTNHYWAQESRDLILIIDTSLELYHNLKASENAFEIDDYYLSLMKACRSFLAKSNGSSIPPGMEKIELYYTIPIFKTSDTININENNRNFNFQTRLIGEGSYAHVHKYKDEFYNRYFVIKRAKKDLNPKELERFKREFEEIKKLSSPYIIEVFCYNENNDEYIMEYMDSTLEKFIKNNSSLSIPNRKGIINQILRAFEYIHSKDILHRDISPKNVLLNKYHDDIIVVKISDFGLIKIPDSKLTSLDTSFKGYLNDPSLIEEGFDSYCKLHETYAITRLIYFIMTGKEKFDPNSKDSDKFKEFFKKGTNREKSERFKTVLEMKEYLKNNKII